MPTIKHLLVAAAVSSVLFGANVAAAAAPVKIKIAWIVPAGDAPLALLGKRGIARHEGKSYTLEFVHFTGTPPEVTALATGEVDLAPIGFPAFALAIENAKLTDLRIIADAIQDGVGNSFSNHYFVLNDGPIKTIEDLKGKIVTSNAIGAAVGPSQLLIMTARTAFIQKHRAALVDFLEDNLRTIAWYFNPANHDEAVKTVAAYTKTPAAVWASWVFTSADSYRDPAGMPNLDALQRNIKAAHDLGFIPADLNPRKYADLSLVEEAAKRIH